MRARCACALSCPPSLTPCPRSLCFVAAGADVNVFATATGECLRTLKGHTEPVSGLVMHNENNQSLITSSLDGTRTREPAFHSRSAWHV